MSTEAETKRYYVFRSTGDRQWQLVEVCDRFPDAKRLCRELRAKESPDNPNAIRMAFAKSEYEARRLLSEKRQPATPLEEWEA